MNESWDYFFAYIFLMQYPTVSVLNAEACVPQSIVERNHRHVILTIQWRRTRISDAAVAKVQFYPFWAPPMHSPISGLSLVVVHVDLHATPDTSRDAKEIRRRYTRAAEAM